MAEQQNDGTWKCQHCGLTSPKGHWRPKTWIEKHEDNCPKKPR
jgi:ribosomal protein L37AE/L43A